jgi:hypothetical protein
MHLTAGEIRALDRKAHHIAALAIARVPATGNLPRVVLKKDRVEDWLPGKARGKRAGAAGADHGELVLADRAERGLSCPAAPSSARFPPLPYSIPLIGEHAVSSQAMAAEEFEADVTSLTPSVLSLRWHRDFDLRADPSLEGSLLVQWLSLASHSCGVCTSASSTHTCSRRVAFPARTVPCSPFWRRAIGLPDNTIRREKVRGW